MERALAVQWGAENLMERFFARRNFILLTVSLTRIPKSRSGWSLVESLAVLGILSLMLAAVVPAVRGMARSSGRVAALDGLTAAFSEARSLAIAQGRPAYLVFADAGMAEDRRCRAVCIYQEAENPADPPVRVTAWSRLPTGFCLNADPALASLFTAPPEVPAPAFRLAGEATPRVLPYLKFGPTGEVLYPDDSQWLRVFLFAGSTNADGRQSSTDQAQTLASADQIKVSPFTGIATCQTGL